MPETGRRYDTLIVVVDANEATIGETDGENIRVLWHERSMVPRKHGKGGQSQQRFARGREEALKSWLRHVVEQIKTLGTMGTHGNDGNDRKIIIGGPGYTKNVLVKEMHVSLQERISDTRHCGYTDENGLWEILGTSRYV